MRKIKMKIHHFGIAVADMKKSRKAYETLGFVAETEVCFDASRNLNILFMTNRGVRIELLEMADREKYSPVERLINKKNRHNIYHTCYETDCLEKEIENLKDTYVVVEKPNEALALERRRVCFLYSNSAGMIELLEYER